VIPTTLGIALLALIGLWLLGGLLLRIGGAVLALAGVAGLALAGDAWALVCVAIGAVLWLAGHWHYALRHHEYKSPLARHLFCRWAPRWLDPTRDWTLAVSTPPADRETGERGRAG
jgi:hypothetical protein